MSTKDSRKEIAQVIPLVALMMLAIVAMVALIIDGGSLMSNRRSAQAAADAAALAGAKQLCSPDTEGNAVTVAHNYAITKNNATTSTENIITSVIISGHTVKGVHVVTTVTKSSFFARIFGAAGLTGRGEATAGCYHPSITTHLIPIAFFYESPPLKSSDVNCTPTAPCTIVNWDYTTLLNTLKATPAKDQPLDDIYIIMNTTKICEKNVSGSIVCSDMKANSDGGNRAWIDLSAVADTSNLKKVIKEGVSAPLYLPSWLNGKPGVDNAVFDDNYSQLDPIPGYTEFNWRLVLLPVFDKFCNRGDPQNDCPSKWTAGDHTEYIVNSSQKSFRLVGLSPFVITCVTKNDACTFGQCIPANTAPNTGNKPICPGYLALKTQDPGADKSAIEGYFVDNSPLQAFVAGTGGVSAGLDVISLTQ